MRPGKEPKRRSRSSSPIRDRTRVPSKFEQTLSGSRPSVSVLDRELATNDDAITLFETNSVPNPRSFPYSVKQQCWDKADKVKGRDPDRWRRDALGNIVFRKLVGCPGCLCHDYDHILPYSKWVGFGLVREVGILWLRGYLDITVCIIRWCNLLDKLYACLAGDFLIQRLMLNFSSPLEGGQSTLENCQVLQATVNRSKGNRTELSRAELIQKSSYCRVSGRDMDLLELSAYGNVRRGQDSGGCRIQ
ncbi:hypothetical protein FEM48_Zijuj05G0144300 [Ziziphus jujuba var. spinosa]|uniref:Uncharacterized protein n=1 Tax=Ziziphus jujuba var. spinosa TaxID=714518 RepID=A0A978VFC3_ZIZJJ|nr:hypothetical protein FEM48_Zijuj05G0144300 [Ziziphus jujuba var. spinosa]